MNVSVKEIISLKFDSSKINPPENTTSRYNLNNILKNYEDFEGVFEIILDFGNGQNNVELATDIGITNSFITACDCLGASLYAPSILFASISVECILNHDIKLNDYRLTQRDEWISLGIKGLQEAEKQNLPVKLLCDNKDCFPTDIKFVKRRNKIAHGDTKGFRDTQFGSYSSKSHSSKSHTTVSYEPEKEHAIYQIKKTREFIDTWAKTNPILRLN